VPAGSARRLKSYAVKDLVSAADAAFINLTLSRDGETSSNELFLTEPKRTRLANAKVTTSVADEGTEGGFSVRLAADAPVFYVALDAGEIAGEFSDNSFTLLPGTPRTISFRPWKKVALEKFRHGLSVRHLRDTYK
jgi:hypothetical protein